MIKNSFVPVNVFLTNNKLSPFKVLQYIMAKDVCKLNFELKKKITKAAAH